MHIHSFIVIALFMLSFSACRPSYFESEYQNFRRQSECQVNTGTGAAVEAPYMLASNSPDLSSGIGGKIQRVKSKLLSKLPGGFDLRKARQRGRGFEFVLAMEGTPICDAYIHAFTRQSSLIARGSLPTRSMSIVGQWPTESEAVGIAQQEFPFAAEVISVNRCLLMDEGALMPVQRIVIGTKGASWQLDVSVNAVHQKHKLGYHGWEEYSSNTTGTSGFARIYDSNPDSDLIDVNLEDLNGSGYLHGQRFATLIEDFDARAFSDSNEFVFEPEDPRFREASVYANAERMASWLTQEQHGYDLGCDTIFLQVNEIDFDDDGNEIPFNNAVYYPAAHSITGHPTVKVGNGDGIQLTNLPVDADVVFHELGHHVVYDAIRSNSLESRILHEALADYFLFAKTGDACVGESICVGGSEVCWQPDCLRNGDNQLSFLAPQEVPFDLHQRSQVVSGMLWSLRKTIGSTYMDTIVFGAIDFLLYESDYEDLVFALLQSENELHEGGFACDIVSESIERGLITADSVTIQRYPQCL